MFKPEEKLDYREEFEMQDDEIYAYTFETYEDFQSWFFNQGKVKSTDKVKIFIKKANSHGDPISFSSPQEVSESYEE